MKLIKSQYGSIELVVLGLLAALIVVLAVPLVGDIGASKTAGALPIDSAYVEDEPVKVVSHEPAAQEMESEAAADDAMNMKPAASH